MAIERIVPGTLEWDAYYQNHISRYKFAVKNLKNKNIETILDAACGVGYGSEYLSKEISGVKVIGVDRSDDALNIANQHFKNDRVNFINDDCHTLNAAASFGSFDAIVSFETLEHLPEPKRFLQSAYSKLEKGGSLIISTPNQLVSSPDGNLKWEYHEKEYKAKELLKILKEAGFADIELYGQRFTSLGKLRKQIRAELNILYSNPFSRAGRWIQKVLKKRKFFAVLPEQQEDFEIVKYNLTDLDSDGINGPFVLIAICKKLEESI